MTEITKTEIHQVEYWTVDAEKIRSLDLRREARGLDHKEQEWVYARYQIQGSAEHVDVLYVPSADRAGVAWGAGAEWTDATSPDDAIERYFAIDGKEMVH